MKKLLLIMVVLMVFGKTALAETSTVSSMFVADKTEIADGDTPIVNFALLGLNSYGEVDLDAEEKGSVIMAVIESELGTIGCGGDVYPGIEFNIPSSGRFANNVKYVRLEQGMGRVCITYEPNVSNQAKTDVVKMFLQERSSTNNGAIKYERIGQVVKKTIKLKPRTVKTNTPALQKLSGIVSYLETDDIPVNSKVALTVEIFDTDGRLYKAVDNIAVTFTTNGKDGDELIPIVFDNDTGQPLLSGQSVKFDMGRKVFIVDAGPRVGQFSLNFAVVNSAATVETRTIDVTRGCGPGRLRCSPLELYNICGRTGYGSQIGAEFDLITGNTKMTSDVMFDGCLSVDSNTSVISEISISDNSEVLWMASIDFPFEDEGEIIDIFVIADYIRNTIPVLQVGNNIQTYHLIGGDTFHTNVYRNELNYDDVTTKAILTDKPLNLRNIQPFITDYTVNGYRTDLVIYEGIFGDITNFVPGTIGIYVGYRKNDQINFSPLPVATLRMLL